MQNKDSLKIKINDDGNIAFDWDKSDPQWKFLNNLTSKEIQSIIENDIKSQQV